MLFHDPGVILPLFAVVRSGSFWDDLEVSGDSNGLVSHFSRARLL